MFFSNQRYECGVVRGSIVRCSDNFRLSLSEIFRAAGNYLELVAECNNAWLCSRGCVGLPSWVIRIRVSKCRAIARRVVERPFRCRKKKLSPNNRERERGTRSANAELFDLCSEIGVVRGSGAVLGDLEGRGWRSRGCLEVCRAEHNVSNESSNSN